MTNNDLSPTSVISDLDNFVPAEVTTPLTEPTTGYAEDFISGSTDSAVVEHVGDSAKDYLITFSGTLVAIDPAFINAFIGVKVVSDAGQEFTGRVKFYPVNVSVGSVTPTIGFSLTVYGEIAVGEKLSLQLSSTTAGVLTLTDLIVHAARIKPAGN